MAATVPVGDNALQHVSRHAPDAHRLLLHDLGEEVFHCEVRAIAVAAQSPPHHANARPVSPRVYAERRSVATRNRAATVHVLDHEPTTYSRSPRMLPPDTTMQSTTPLLRDGSPKGRLLSAVRSSVSRNRDTLFVVSRDPTLDSGRYRLGTSQSFVSIRCWTGAYLQWACRVHVSVIGTQSPAVPEHDRTLCPQRLGALHRAHSPQRPLVAR